MAELVSQHTAQLVARQRVDGVRRDDHEVPPAGERVQLVDRQHGDDESSGRQAVGLQDRSPGDVERRPLVSGRPPGTQQWGQDRHLHRTEEQQQ